MTTFIKTTPDLEGDHAEFDFAYRDGKVLVSVHDASMDSTRAAYVTREDLKTLHKAIGQHLGEEAVANPDAPQEAPEKPSTVTIEATLAVAALAVLARETEAALNAVDEVLS